MADKPVVIIVRSFQCSFPFLNTDAHSWAWFHVCVLSSGSSPLWGHHEEGQSEESEQIWWEHWHIHRILQTLWAHLLWRHILHYHDQLCKVKVRPKNKQPLNSRLQPFSCSLWRQFIMRELCFASVIAMTTTAGWLSWFVSLKGIYA